MHVERGSGSGAGLVTFSVSCAPEYGTDEGTALTPLQENPDMTISLNVAGVREQGLAGSGSRRSDGLRVACMEVLNAAFRRLSFSG